MRIVLREDIAAAEQCYMAIHSDDSICGFLQKYQDGSASYWWQPMQQAKMAQSVGEAVKRLHERHES